MKALTPAPLTRATVLFAYSALPSPRPTLNSPGLPFRPQPRDPSDSRFLSRLSAIGHSRLRHYPAGSPRVHAETGSCSYRLAVRLQLLPTTPLGGAVTFGYKVTTYSDRDFHPADKASSRTHWMAGSSPAMTTTTTRSAPATLPSSTKRPCHVGSENSVTVPSRVLRRANDATINTARPSRTGGNTTMLTADQPNFANSCPDENDPIAIIPNTRKSLNACTLLRSWARCVSSTSAEAPTKPKFQPTPNSISVAQKCQVVMPERPMVAAIASSVSPSATMRGAPNRAIKEPVKKLGPYIATICH